jgi:beta-mannosidase
MISATNLASSSGKISCLGCGSYPTLPKLLDSIREEAICNVRRLRYHPSIVIYAGNNEEYQIQEQYKLEYNFADKDPELWL